MRIARYWLTLVLVFASCKQASTTPGKPDGGFELPELIVRDDSSNLLFTFLLADGSFKTVDRIQDVPEEARDQVVVTDTSLTPEQRQSSKIIFVADLTRKRPDGTYPCRPVSRFRFERDLLREPASKGALPEECKKVAESPRDRAILYGTSWCGVCKATAEFLHEQGIPFEEKDVEKDPQAQRELSCKALRTGTQVNGVPVLDIGGKLLVGFDRDEILRLSAGLENRKSNHLQ